MQTLPRNTIAVLLVLFVFSFAFAQGPAQSTVSQSGPTITAAAAGERVRITAPSSVVQMRLEIYSATGQKLVDNEVRGGNVFDWHLQDGQGQRLAPGDYVCVVTAKSVNGKLTQKIGSVSVEEKSVSIQPGESSQLSPAQAQTIGPVEENSSWKTSGDDEPQTPTVIAHNGTDGQMIRGRGALTFRIGNFFSGIDKEQMRLTEDGRLGIGTSEPKATLDVAGTVRAQRFEIVKPKNGSLDKTATPNALAAADESGGLLLTGSGTQDRIAKWLDNSGTLGDSGITEVGGNVGIGTTAPGSKLVVSSNSSTLPPALGIARFADADGVQTAVFADSFGTNPIFNVRRANGTAASPSAVQASQLLGVIGASAYGATAYTGTRARVAFWASENWTDTANGTYLTFNTTPNGAATPGGAERLRIDSLGRVGIGTPNPTARLHVAGDVLFENQWRTETTTVNPGPVPGPPNLIGGFLGTGNGGATPGNRVTPGVVGATIGGGGFNGSITAPSGGTSAGDGSNRVTDWFGTVGGGFVNYAGNGTGTLDDAGYATVGGGIQNAASGSAATVGGGGFNIASGFSATVPGGIANAALGSFSFATGQRAKANHTGTFVWADSTLADFASTGSDQFLIRANGGVGIGLNNPSSPLTVNGVIESKSGGIKFPDATTQTTAVNGANFVQKAGDTMTGTLNLPANGLVAGTNQLTLSGGNVGIGTAAPDAKLQVASGDVYVQTQGRGIILRATDGANCYRFTVNNAGTPAVTLIACP